MKRLIFFICISSLFIACESRKEEKNKNFPKTINLVKYETILNDNNSILLGAHIEIIDSLAIIREYEGEYQFTFIDLKKKEVIKKWGQKGRGPNEFISLSHYSVQDGELHFGDPVKKQTVSIAIDSILKKENPKLLFKPYPYTRDFRPNHMYKLNDKKLVLGSFNKGRIGLLDDQNSIMGTFGEYPFNNDPKVNEIRNFFKGSLYQGNLVVNPKNNKFCIINFASDAFEIFQYNDEKIEKVFTSDFSNVPLIKEIRKNVYVVNGKSLAGLVDITATEEYIYISYSDKTLKENVLNSNESNEILCFDWEGNKIAKFKTAIPVSRIGASKDYLYGIHYDNDNGKTIFLRYKL
jgi:hypothetical protein